MSEVRRWKLKGFIPGIEGETKAVFQPTVVLAEEYDAALAREAALREDLARANEKIDKAWNQSLALDHQGFTPGALDAWKRPVKQHLPYDFSGNPGASATQYCNGWNDSGGYWSAHAKDLHQRLTDAEKRVTVLSGLVEEGFAAIPSQQGYDGLLARMLAALKPVEGAQS